MADINLGVGGANSATGGFNIENSCKFENDNVEKMTHTYDSAPTSQQKGTMSIWYKRTEIGTNIGLWQFGDDSSGDYLAVRWARDVYGSGESYRSKTDGTSLNIGGVNGAVRDTGAWYHMVVAIDTTQATAANRFRVYRNGEELTWSSDSRASIAQNANMAIGENGKDIIIGEGVYRFNGYIAEVNYVDGQQLSSTDFGEYDEDSGIWIPKKYTGTYGNNGFYLDFKNASNLGEDKSGNNHDFTLNNITSANQATDTPTNNFCTINPLIPYYGSVSEGATKFLHTPSGDGWESFVATMGAGTSGKWYAEFKFVASGSVDNVIGICPIDDPDLNRGADHFALYGSNTSLDESVGYYAANGYRYIGGGGAAYGNTWAVTNIMSIAVDMDNGKLYFAKDGVWQNSGDPTSGATGTGALDVRGATKPQSLGASNYTSGQDILANYGGYTTISISTPETDENGYGTFEYAPPSGYYALCTKNLAEYG
jgi:hypothetical protein